MSASMINVAEGQGIGVKTAGRPYQCYDGTFGAARKINKFRAIVENGHYLLVPHPEMVRHIQRNVVAELAREALRNEVEGWELLGAEAVLESEVGE